MGKSKTRKGKDATDSASINSPVSQSICTCGHSHDDPPRAADGHNVEGWTSEDIRIYNELLTERAKLEKEKNELEQKSARHAAERALLNEDGAAFDNLFKVQLSGEYKFTGSSTCCLNFSSDPVISKTKCHHEICSRAKSKGVSWLEYDTIRYYQTRIKSERSARMKNALQKQRDVELERVKKDDEEELASRNRRSAMLDKALTKKTTAVESRGSANSNSSTSLEKDLVSMQRSGTVLDALQTNENVVRKLNMRIDRIMYAFQAGDLSAHDASSQMYEVEKEMELANKQSEQFREMIFGTVSSQDFSNANSSLSRALSASLAASSKDAFSQALNVMKGFFSASEQQGVQATMDHLRGMLDGGVTASNQYKSFKSLDEINALPNAQGFSKKVTTNGSKTTKICTNVVDILLHLRNKEDSDGVRIALRDLKIEDSLAAANEQAIDQARRAFGPIIQYQKKELADPSKSSKPEKITADLKSIKEKAVKASHLPPITDVIVQEQIDTLLALLLGVSLWKTVKVWKTTGEKIDEQALRAMTVGRMLVYAERKSSKYPMYFEKLEKHMERLRDQDEEVCTILRRVLDEIKSKVLGTQSTKPAKHEVAHPNVPMASRSKLPTPHEMHHKMPRGAMRAAHDPSYVKTRMAEDQNTVAAMRLETQKAQLAWFGQNLAESLGSDKPILSPEAMQYLKNGLEYTAQNTNKASLPPQMRQELNKLAEQYLSSLTNQANSAGKNTKSTANQSPGKTSKFHEDLATTPAASEQQNQDADKVASEKHKHVSTEELARALAAAGAAPVSGHEDDSIVTPPPYTANEKRARSAPVRVKHVPVSTPQISGSTAPGIPGTGSTAPSAVPAVTTSSPVSSVRETAIRNQLVAMRGNLDQLKTRAQPPAVLSKDGLGLKDPFNGIVGKIEEQYKGHLAMAKEIASTNKWNGLSEWLEKRG